MAYTGVAALLSFGSKATVVKTGEFAIVKTGLEISIHASKQMAERKVSEKMVEKAILKGIKYYDPKNGTFNYVLKNAFASGKDLLVGTNTTTGRIVTVIRGKSLAVSRFIKQ